MSISNRHLPFSLSILVYINLVMLLLIVFFGLYFKSGSLANNVVWIDGRDGIRFGHYGMAYSLTAFQSMENRRESTELSLELAVRPEDTKDDRFKILLSVHDGKDSEQLLIGQWRFSLIVMNGDDYDGSKKIPKVDVHNALSPEKDTFITITSGINGTKVYINGRLRESSRHLFLKIPSERSDAVLVLGNSPYGRHSWPGDVFGLAIYKNILNPDDAASHFNQWSQQHAFSFPRKIDPMIFYTFEENSGLSALDHGTQEHHLVIPERIKIIRKEILVAPWNEHRLDRQLVQDMVVNFIGFIPPGFFLFALMTALGNYYEKHGFLLTVLICFLISLAIELSQAWMPSRSSQSLDLIFNTLGSCLGVMFYRIYQNMFYNLDPIEFSKNTFL